MKISWLLSGIGVAGAVAFLQCSGDDDVASTPPTSNAEGGTSCTSPTQVAGDCQKSVCNADGTTGSVADDSDVPPAVACRTRACSAGKITETPFAAGTACQGGTCDGAGTCGRALGSACTTAAECPSGHCVDGVCCNEACTGECRGCSLDGGAGTCSNIPYYEPDPGYRNDAGADAECTIAVQGGLCDGQGACKRLSGRPCQGDENCMSNKCSGTLECLGAKGEFCTLGPDCVSNSCDAGACN